MIMTDEALPPLPSIVPAPTKKAPAVSFNRGPAVRIYN
jgi:hypothetical protein